MFSACEQCGSCSSACPLTGEDGFNIRRIIRHIELGLIDDIASTPHPWACTTCGRCESACPNGIAVLDVVRLLRAMCPAEFAADVPPPCVKACPAGIDIPGYVRLIAQGKPDLAHDLILESVPFPGVLGRVCTHPCENQCRRAEVNAPVSICALKRYAADNRGGSSIRDAAVEPDTGRKVAVVGAGPAGLTAAYYLRKKGHQVTVFEARSKPGGMLRYGIPSYRLPEAVLVQEIDDVLSLGIELVTDRRLGVDFDLAQLREDGFEAVFVALGLQEGRRIDLDGAQLDDVSWGIEFLTEVAEGRDVTLRDRVTVIGGGSVAVDVALTALRLGAAEVTLACLESREEMPANRWEVETALEEGVSLMPSWGPTRIIDEGGRVTGIELVACTSVFDQDGNFGPTFGERRVTVETDQVILAIGQSADLSMLDANAGVEVEGGLIVVDRQTQRTAARDLFAGGDVVRGPGSIIDAIADGKRAASAIDELLGGDGEIECARTVAAVDESYDGKRESGFADLKRAGVPTLPLAERHDGFREVELGLSSEEAVQEACRCLQCDFEIALARRIAAGS